MRSPSSSSSSSSIRHLQPLRVWAASVWRFWDHTPGHTTVGRTPLDEWSARRSDLYLTNTQHSQRTTIHAPGGIRTRNSSRRSALDHSATGTGIWRVIIMLNVAHSFHQSTVIFKPCPKIQKSYHFVMSVCPRGRTRLPQILVKFYI